MLGECAVLIYLNDVYKWLYGIYARLMGEDLASVIFGHATMS